MTDIRELQRWAQEALQRLKQDLESPRFRHVMGRFVTEGLLISNRDYPQHQEPIAIEDVLWAGEIEPRILELLPALLCQRPTLFSGTDALPPDLEASVRQLETGRVPPDFRGVAGTRQTFWLGRLG